MVGDRAEQRGADPPSPVRRKHTRGAECAAAEVGGSSDAAADVGPVERREQQQATRVGRLLELRGGDRLVRHDAALDPRPALEIRRGCRLAQLDHPDRFSLPFCFAYRSPARKMSRPIGIEKNPITSSGHTSAQARPAP